MQKEAIRQGKNFAISRKKFAYVSELQSYHVLYKLSTYERNIQSGKIVAEHLKKQIAHLENAVKELTVSSANAIKPKRTIHIAGVNLTIDPSLPSLVNDPFILEKTRRAELNFSNSANDQKVSIKKP